MYTDNSTCICYRSKLNSGQNDIPLSLNPIYSLIMKGYKTKEIENQTRLKLF